MVVAFVVLAPLGVCLGMFMPLGIGTVAGLSAHPHEYVAWGWAVNGFASVVGAVLTTIIAMAFGFNVVLVIGLMIYLVALGGAALPCRRATPSDRRRHGRTTGRCVSSRTDLNDQPSPAPSARATSPRGESNP